MAKLPVVSCADIVKVLCKNGFVMISQRGSHIKLANNNGRSVIIPAYDEVPKGTFMSILRQAGLNKDEFTRLLKTR